MSLIKAPKATAEFISGAPDGTAKKVTDEQHQIGLRLPLDLLASVDTAAKALNLSRAGFIKMTLTKALEK